MSMSISCGSCGERPYTEFSFGGEWRELEAPDRESDFDRVYLPENLEGPQRERWFHVMGCRTWTTVVRDTRTNVVTRPARDGASVDEV